MSTTYYLRLKDDNKLNDMRDTLTELQEQMNVLLEKVAEMLSESVVQKTMPIKEKDNFNKQFCNASGWYGSYPDEPSDYHLGRICLESVEHIQIEIGVYTSGEFHWKLMDKPDGYYDLQGDADTEWYNLKELKVYEFPRSKEQFKTFMKKYKNKVEIVNEYSEVFTLTQFLKEVDEY